MRANAILKLVPVRHDAKTEEYARCFDRSRYLIPPPPQTPARPPVLIAYLQPEVKDSLEIYEAGHLRARKI